jgi:hypothetical protein
MKGFGIFLLVAGSAIAAGSLLMPTTAPVEVPSGSLYGLPTRSDVYNLGLLQQQMMIFVIGCAVAVLGGTMSAVGHLGERLLLPTEPIDQPTSSPIEPLAPVGTPDQVPTSNANATAGADSDFAWIIGIAAVGLLFVFLAILAGSLADNSGSPANVAAINVAGTVTPDDMMANDPSAMTDNAVAAALKPAEKATRAKPERHVESGDPPMDGDGGPSNTDDGTE